MKPIGFVVVVTVFSPGSSFRHRDPNKSPQIMMVVPVLLVLWCFFFGGGVAYRYWGATRKNAVVFPGHIFIWADFARFVRF